MILIQIERVPTSFDMEFDDEKYNDGAVGKALKVSLECIHSLGVCRLSGEHKVMPNMAVEKYEYEANFGPWHVAVVAVRCSGIWHGSGSLVIPVQMIRSEAAGPAGGLQMEESYLRVKPKAAWMFRFRQENKLWDGQQSSWWNGWLVRRHPGLIRDLARTNQVTPLSPKSTHTSNIFPSIVIAFVLWNDLQCVLKREIAAPRRHKSGDFVASSAHSQRAVKTH